MAKRKNKLGWLAPAALVLGIGIGVYVSRKPWERYLDIKAGERAMAQELKELNRQRAQSIREEVARNDSVRLEEAARKKGYVRRGEIELKIKQKREFVDAHPFSEPTAQRRTPPVQLREPADPPADPPAWAEPNPKETASGGLR